MSLFYKLFLKEKDLLSRPGPSCSGELCSARSNFAGSNQALSKGIPQAGTESHAWQAAILIYFQLLT